MSWRTGCHVLIVRSSGQTGFKQCTEDFLADRKHKQFPYELGWQGAASLDLGYLVLEFFLRPPEIA